MPETESPDPARETENPDARDLPAISPDVTEEDLAGKMDDVIPFDTKDVQPVVGLGGSAGSITAMRTFFEHMPPDSGLAFVVVLHLSPEHESSLAALLQHTTAMPVVQVTESVKVAGNTVYVISPAQRLSMADGELCVSELEPRRGRHVVVDLFFRALADTHGPRGTAIVLSGADSDGAIGIKRVKERGGLCIAQDPGEAEYDGMPRASVDTGLMDWVLPVDQMPRRVLDYFRREKEVRLPSEEEPHDVTPPDGEGALREILAFLRMRTGRDFSYYKRATVLRRLGRRMQVNGVDDLPAYLIFLRTHPAEAAALLQDLLISVTNFFRDRESFEVLEAEIPRLFHGKGMGEQVRVWVAGCATGEEAYSVAMLLAEYAETLDFSPAIQVFATDIDEVSIRASRDALYPEIITADVSQERLRRFFAREAGGYRLKREIREMILFAPHDLLKDAPFSRLDLVTCRNLLIYLNRFAQSRVFDIFHFALRQGGLLFLGTSESAEDAGHLFGLRDKKHRLYARLPSTRPAPPPPLAAGPGSLALALHAPIPNSGHLRRRVATAAPLPVGEPSPLTWGEVHFRLLESFAPPSLLVDADNHVIHLSENAGRFLRFSGGEPSANLLRVVDPRLRLELRTALFRARQVGEPVEVRDVLAEVGGERRAVSLRVRPALDLAPGYLIVVFEESTPGPATPPPTSSADPVILHLERELDQLRGRHQETIEQYEASTEELKASNEELQAMNEELRSATEELETGREELQSINEELVTVNHELKDNVEELGRSNSDLQNLMASTNIATVFVDRELCVKRFTPSAVALFNLIPADVGRPLYDLRGTLDYDALSADAGRVLAQLIPVEQEVRADDGRVFLARLLPYRTMDDHIAGVGLTFIDLTALRRAEAAHRESEARFSAFLRQATVPVAECDLSGRYVAANAPYCELVGRTETALIGVRMADITAPEDVPRQNELFARLAVDGIPFENEKRYLLPDGTPRWVHCSVSAVRDASGKPTASVTVSVDISERKEAEVAMRRSDLRFRLIFENAREVAIFTMDRDGAITGWNPGSERLFGWAAEEILGRSVRDLLTREDIDGKVVERHTGAALREGRCESETWFVRRDGSRFWGAEVLTPLLEDGEVTGFLKIMRDRTDELQAREARQYVERERARLFEAEQAARQEAVAANAAKDRFLASLSHELRTPLTPIRMAVFALKREKRLSPTGQEMLGMITRNLEAEMRLIDDLLDVNRIIHDKLELRLAPLDLHDCVRSAAEICQADFAAKGQPLNLELDAGRHELLGDSSRLRQVFWNLLKNAAKFTPDGGSITVRSRNADGNLAVEVADTGIGLEPGTLETVFGAFEQGGAAITREYGGLGLGLAISRAIVQAHGGELTATSAGRDQGATFTVTLPLEPPVSGTATPHLQEASA